MDSRPFNPSDLAQVQALMPGKKLPHKFFVLEHDQQIVACGGYEIPHSDSAQITAYCVHTAWRKQGLGRFLIFYLLKQITDEGEIRLVTVNATEGTEGFFQKQGFHPSGQQLFTKKLTVCA